MVIGKRYLLNKFQFNNQIFGTGISICYFRNLTLH